MTKDVLFELINSVGRITLNRPEALHALNHTMCKAIYDQVTAWSLDPSVSLIIIDHASGSRGFCAGGDIRFLADSGRGDGKAGADFFADEYRMNVALARCAKPIISFLDGVTMGGGVGLSIHGSHRLVTDRTLFAMPETGIGLFPDVGGSWFLPRLEGELGLWLGLTGARLKGADVVSAGIGTHYIEIEAVESLKAALFQTPDRYQFLIDEKALVLPKSSYCDHRTVINTCFDKDSLSQIILALKLSDNEWADEQCMILSKRAPLSMMVTHRAYREGREMNALEDVMQMEYRIASRIISTPDFLEGVRAAVIDKDHAPRWSPSSLAEVEETMVGALFAPLDQELTFSHG
jgi:enoyl-CoA hydratase